MTAKRNAERRARELAEQELLHRLRNISNVMTAIVRMTSREETNIDDFAIKITERLATPSDAHFQTISRAKDENLSAEVLVDTILLAYAPLGGAHYKLSGPEVILPTHLLSCLALLLRELATNAVKYGALSSMTGQILVDWHVSSDANRLHLCWEETGGPKVVEPTRASGSQIVRDMIRAAGGSTQLDWRESGLIMTADFPL